MVRVVGLSLDSHAGISRMVGTEGSLSFLFRRPAHAARLFRRFRMP